MRKLFGITLLAAALALGQEPAKAQEHAETGAKHGEASHEEGESPMPNEIWWKWANFAVLALGLGYLIKKYAGPYFASRAEEIQKGIRDAAQVRAEAEARAAAIESQISNLTGAIQEIQAASKAEITAEGQRVKAETEAQIAKIQSHAEAEIASATKHAKLELKAYSAQLAVDLAEKQIRGRLDSNTQGELANVFVNDLRQVEEAGRAQ